MSDDTSLETSGVHEEVVTLDNLPYAIQDLSPVLATVAEDTFDRTDSTTSAPRALKDSGRSARTSVDCIYVDRDHYFDVDRPVSKTEVSNYKVVIKTMKAIVQKGETFVAAMSDPSLADSGGFLPVFAAADLSFWALRDFGTYLMKCGDDMSSTRACQQAIEQYPKFKRSLRTLGLAIDNFMKRNGIWVTASASQGTVRRGKRTCTLLLYGRVDDRFDMVSLEGQGNFGNGKHTRKK